MEHAKVDKQLSRMGWKFMSDSKPTDDIMGQAVWAYEPNVGGATAWCVLYYNTTSPSRILYNIYGGYAIQKIQKKIKRRKVNIMEEGQELERVQYLAAYADYPDDQYIMRLMTYKQPNYYGIKIFDKSDYLKAKKNGRL
ncbi:hypothetical protein [Pontibacter harenae]|uniref:hypothetical protein n=1 Tax=Pontibacter harenae TaxID=2894083 RepID=UPI001E3326A9|nr:hypothetical protein [Pontibacter harenae]MCC9168094.1 hypothetical protein [Pontibacter harenae]